MKNVFQNCEQNHTKYPLCINLTRFIKNPRMDFRTMTQNSRVGGKKTVFKHCKIIRKQIEMVQNAFHKQLKPDILWRKCFNCKDGFNYPLSE